MLSVSQGLASAQEMVAVPWRKWRLLLLTLLLSSCGDDRPPLWSLTTSADARVPTVDIRLPQRGELRYWHLSDTPSVSVGSVQGEGPYLLEAVPSARTTRDGELLVLNAGTSPGLRWFTSEGRFVRSVEGYGKGPGEFIEPSRVLEYRGDSVAVWDTGLRRITVLSAQGRVGRVVTLAMGRMVIAPSIRASRPDGTFLGTKNGFFLSHPDRKHGWETTPLMRFDEVGQLVGTVGEFPYVQTRRNGRGMASPVYLGGTGSLLDVPPGFAWARTDIGRVSFYDAQGALVRVVQLRGVRRRVTEEYWDRYIQDFWEKKSEELPPGAVASIRDLSSGPRAKLTPLVAEYISVEGRAMWLRPFSSPWDPHWPVLRIDLDTGEVIAIETPPERRIMEIGRDYLLVRWLDEWGVPHVASYALIRGNTSAPRSGVGSAASPGSHAPRGPRAGPPSSL